MDPTARDARQRQKRLEEQLEGARHEVGRIERACPHHYTITYVPIYHEGHECPGDPPGTMGVDWRGPVYVPPHTEDRWRRYCDRCGKEEYTTHARTEIETKSTKVPTFFD